jgi:ribonuclease VapC
VIIDASALLAVVLAEPDAARYAQAIAVGDDPRFPSVSWFEAAMQGDTSGDNVIHRFDDCIREFDIRIIPLTAEHARHARVWRHLYGRGIHPARLNFGDCLVCGVAKAGREPRPFKGNDFAQTDIEPALKG